MAVFTTENQTSAYAKDPSYYTGSGFVLGMLGYKKNGQKSLFGKIKDVALPVIGSIAGTAIGGPAGAKIGATIGQGLNAASTAAAEGIVGGDEDSLANVTEDMSGTLARGNLGISLGNVAGGVQAGVQAGDGIGKILKDVAPTFNKDLPAIGSGLAGAIGANATTTYPIGKRVRYFATGGEVTPSPAMAARLALQRAQANGQVASASSTAVARPINPLSIPITLPEVTVKGKRNNNPLEAAGAQIGEKYVADLKADPRYKKSPWSVGSPTDIIDPLISFPGQVLDQATKTNQNAILKPSTVVDALTTADLKIPVAASVVGGALLKKAAPHLKRFAREVADPALEAGLRQSRVLGAEKGWSAEQIAKHQFDNHGITDNQRKAYVPIVSNVLANHIYPFGYNGAGNIKSKARILKDRANPDQADRFNAWDLYLGKPQKPVPDESAANGMSRKTFDYVGKENGEDVLLYNNYQVPTLENKDMLNIHEGRPFVKRDTRGIMGGYGIHPMGGDNYQYRDRWDLDFPVSTRSIEDNVPGARPIINTIFKHKPELLYNRTGPDGGWAPKKLMDLKLEKVIGKPFQSRGNLRMNAPDAGAQLPYLTTNYKNGGEVKPFTYTYAGMTFRIKQPKDYKVYDKNDHTEDLVITDKDGNHYGQMRIGERVQDQHSNLAMKAIMSSSVSEEKKKEALGELLHEELISHDANEEGESMYQGGGDVKPRKSGATTVTTVNESRARAARMGNNSGKLAQLKADLASAQANLAATTNPAAKLRYQNNINSMQAEINAAAPPAAPKPAPATVKTTAPAAAVKPSTAPVVTSNRPAVPNSVRRGASAGSRPKVAAPPVTAQSRIAKMTHGQLVSTMGRVTTPEIITSNVPSAPESARPAVTPNMDKVASAIGVNTPATATNYDPHPKVEEPSPKSSVDNVGNLMDISRVVTGAVMASKKTPTYSLPARFTNWQSQVEAKANQGYSAPEWNTINGQIADNFSAGETALTNSVGSGATPGVVLAGLTRLNQQRAQQTQAAAVGDVARRAQNFSQFGAMVNQDMNLDREQFDQRLATVQSGQQAGVQLAQSGLQNIEQRKLYNDNYGSGSLYDKLMNKQVDKETEATNVLKRMRLAAVKNGTAAVE